MPSLTKVQSGFMEAQGALPLSPGTAAAPGLKFDDHAGTGMFSPSTGEIAFSTSGHSQAVTFKTDGKVGIGTDSPYAKLHVNITSPTSVPAAGSNNHPVVIGNVGFGAAIGALNTGESYIQGTRWDGTATNYSLLLNPNGGNVGIGTASPSSPLHVSATNNSGWLAQLINAGTGTDANGLLVQAGNSSTEYSFKVSRDDGTDLVSVRGNGLVGIGAANNTSYDTNAQNLLLASSGNTGMTIRSAGSTPFAMIHFADGTTDNSQKRAGRIMYQHDGDNLTFHTANEERLRFDGDGKGFIGSNVEHGSGKDISNKGLVVTSDGENTLKLLDSTSYDTNVGASILLGGNYRASGDTQPFVRLKSFKENSTDGNYSYGFSISTNANGGSITERFQINSSGQILAGGADTTLAHANADDLIIGNTSSGTRTGITLVCANNQDAGLYFSDGTSTGNANIQGQIVYNHADSSLKFYTAATSAVTIKNGGHTDFTGYADFIRPANDSYSYAGFGPGGTNAKAAFIRRGSEIDLEMWSNYSGSPTVSINSNGSIFGGSMNLQNSATSSWFQTGTSIASYNYVWAAKDSSANVWHSGLQTDGDLYLGGNLAGSNNIGLNGSNGSAFFATGALNIGTTGTVSISHPTTSARIKMSGDISGNYTGWKERNVASGSMSQASIDSKTPTINDFTYPENSNGMLIWSTSKIGFAAGSASPQYGTGVQMVFDNNALVLGGYRAFDRTIDTNTNTNWNIRLKTNGQGQFKSTLYANPFQLTSANSWMKSAYGAITNSTVQSLNNLMIAQNIRGYIEGIDGGSTNNNFYSVVTHGNMGYAGTEYCYNGDTKFYNGSASSMGGATSANTAFSPSTSMRINGNGIVTKPNNPSFQVSRNQSGWTVNAATKFDWNLVVHNTGSHFSVSNDRFTAPVAGTYQFNFSIIWYHQTLANEWVSLRKNGSRFTGGDIHFSANFSTTRWHHISYSASVYLSSGDYVEMFNGGSTNIYYHGSTWSQWSGYLVG